MDASDLLLRLALALGMGLLVGMQRQYVRSQIGGVRTFPLIALFGALMAIASQQVGGWAIGLGALAVVGLLAIANAAKFLAKRFDAGLTTEFAALVLYAVGVILVLKEPVLGIVVGAATAVLLQWKGALHRFIRRIGPADFRSIMQFVLIALVILPALPNQNMGPLNVFNPRNIWLMVVLIVGIELLGYVVYKLVGERTGILVNGVLGGLISSTASTVSFSRQAKESPQFSDLAAIVILIASAVSFVRVMALAAIVAPESAVALTTPLLVPLLATVLLAVVKYFTSSPEMLETKEQKNPADLKSAILFAGLYAVILFCVEAANRYAGPQALYAISFLSGLPDINAIALSTSRLVSTHSLDLGAGWRCLMIAALANTLLKGVLVAWLGSRSLAWEIAVLFAVVILSGVSVLWFWP